MTLVLLAAVCPAVRVLHLALDSVSAADVPYLPALETIRQQSTWTHRLKAEPFTDSGHGWGSTFYGVGAARHCEYSNDIRGCTGIPTLESVLRSNSTTTAAYRENRARLEWFEKYFESVKQSDTVPVPDTTGTDDEYVVYLYSLLDHTRHMFGPYGEAPLMHLKRINDIIATAVANEDWEVIIISSDHGWKRCNNGINVACKMHSGAELSEVNTPFYLYDRRDEDDRYIAVGEHTAPLTHADIAPTILALFDKSNDLPCEWKVGVRVCQSTTWPGTEQDVLTKSDEADAIIDGLLGTVTCALIVATPLISGWLLGD